MTMSNAQMIQSLRDSMARSHNEANSTTAQTLLSDRMEDCGDRASKQRNMCSSPARRQSSLGDDERERVASLALRHAKNYERRSSFRDVEKEESVRSVPVDALMIERLLGTGTFSNVYEASISSKVFALDDVGGEEERRYHGGDRSYAVKQLKLRVMDDAEQYEIGAIDLAMEAKFLSSMSHENIVKLHGVTSGCISEAFSSGFEGSFFLVLDKMECTLKDRLKVWAEKKNASRRWGILKSSGHKKICDRLNVALGIAHGLKYLHSNNIIYRDMKPENIGFDISGKVKIFDFGLARELLPDEDKRPTGMTGTLRYMAPEVAQHMHYGVSSDTYSFGILLWEICALERPFRSYHKKGRGNFNEETWKEEVVLGDMRPKLQRSWPKGLKSLMRDCWAADASQRPKMEQAASTIDAEISVLSGGTVQVSTSSLNSSEVTFESSQD